MFFSWEIKFNIRNWFLFTTNAIKYKHRFQLTDNRRTILSLDNIVCIAALRMTQLEFTATYGKTLMLECVLIGSPNAKSVCWHKQAQNNTTKDITTDVSKYKGSTVNNPSLVIIEVNENDSGLYFCTAKVDDRVLRGNIVSVCVQGMV